MTILMDAAAVYNPPAGLKPRVPLGTCIALAGNALVLWLSSPLFAAPSGSLIHPNRLLVASALCAITTLAAGVLMALQKDRRIHTLWALTGVLLSCLPVLFITVGWDLLATKRGYWMSMTNPQSLVGAGD